MKGIVICAVRNDLILVLTRSFNGEEENKKISRLRIILRKRQAQFGTICSLIYQNGRSWGSLAPSPSRREEHFLQGAESGSTGKN